MRQGRGTDVEEGGGRTLQDLSGIWDTGWTPERWEREEGSNPEGGEKPKTVQEDSQTLFSLLLLCQSMNLCYAYTVLLYVCKCSSSHKLELNSDPNEPPSLNNSLIRQSLLSSVHYRSPEYAECTQ